MSNNVCSDRCVCVCVPVCLSVCLLCVHYSCLAYGEAVYVTNNYNRQGVLYCITSFDMLSMCLGVCVF